MNSQRWIDKKVVPVRSAIDGFDAKYKKFPMGEISLITVPQTQKTQGVSEKQREVASTYVDKFLLKAMEDGVRVKYVTVGKLTKQRKSELESLQNQFPDLLELGESRGRSLAVRIQTLERLLNKLGAAKGTDLILIDGVETLTQDELMQSKGWIESCFMNEPNSLQFFARICKCPVVMIQLETHSKRAHLESVENIWLRNAEIAISLRQRGGLSLVATDGTIRRGIEARLLKSPKGSSDEDCWMV